jgi:ferredoxin-NADP reductase
MNEYLLPLTDRRDIADGTMAFWFDASSTGFSFVAGQYATFTQLDPIEVDAEGIKRDFSIASAPHELPRIMITTRMRDTAFKRNLKNIPLGTKIRISAPMGSLVLHKNADRPALFLVGGIGITPIRSIIADAIYRKLPHNLMLLYSNRTVASTAFLADFEAWAKENHACIFIPTITDEQPKDWTHEVGQITEPMLRTHLVRLTSQKAGNPSPIAYIVGPPAFVSAMLPIAEGAGIDPDNIRTEEFAGY